MIPSKTLKVKFNEVPTGGLDYEFTDRSGELNGALFDLLGDHPVYRAELHLKPVDSMVHFRGHLSGELHHICSRCAEDFQQKYDKTFLTAFYRDEDSIKHMGATIDEVEDASNFDLEFLDGNEIDLGEVVHEQVALEFPFKPLCSEECKGLCPQCGTNLNFSACHCDRSKKDLKLNSPFATLKSLKPS